MTATPKLSISRALAYTELLDAQAAGPFVGIHLGEPGKIHIRRTAPTGYIETEGAPSPEDPDWIFAHLPHLLDVLKYIESEAVDILRLTSGSLLLRSVNSAFESEMRVHTVSRSHSGFKVHDPGMSYRVTEVGWLQGLNIKPFVLAMPPIIHGSNILLVTHNGTVLWDTGTDPGLPSSPRDTFLRALGDVDQGVFTLTQNGYFAACFNDMTFAIAGHQTTFPGAVPSVTGATRMAEVAAERLIYALKSSAALAPQGVPITLTPRGGIITRNQYGQPVRFGLGETGPFMPVDIFERSAKTIAAALDQTQGDMVTIYRTPGTGDRILFARGCCLVAVQGVASNPAG